MSMSVVTIESENNNFTPNNNKKDGNCTSEVLSFTTTTAAGITINCDNGTPEDISSSRRNSDNDIEPDSRSPSNTQLLGASCSSSNDEPNNINDSVDVQEPAPDPPVGPEILLNIPLSFCCSIHRSLGSGIGEPSVNHALVIIFLEFFAWGLLTTPMISVLDATFPTHTFLMNGLIVGIKGFLSFLSAPLIGALSDVWGRKLFLVLTVFFTCAPIPLMQINTYWYFAMISISGVFAVTFSVVFAYVADVTPGEQERSAAYGLVSATFAASLVTSPALGSYLEEYYGIETVVSLATAIAALDVLFVLVAVPESLPQKLRVTAWTPLAWEQADPFAALKQIGKDKTILLLCVTVLLSYLPEAGQYSCFFVYLQLVVGFKKEEVAMFIAMVGIMSVVAQTAVLGLLMKNMGPRKTIVIGLLFEMVQLAWYGFGSQRWMMWTAGILAALSSITYPGISAFVSTSADPDKQGLAQGMITGMRGLCNGLGPAVFGIIFYLFHVDLNEELAHANHKVHPPLVAGDAVAIANHTVILNGDADHKLDDNFWLQVMPGPPFVFGSLMVVLAVSVALFIPEKKFTKIRRQGGSDSSDFIDLENPHLTPGAHTPSQTMAPLIPPEPAIL